MKKLLALLLVAAMALTMFAACNNTTPDPTDAKPTDAKSTEATPTEGNSTEATKADDGAVDTSWILEEDTNMSGEVNFWIPFKGSQGMDAMIAEFNETYPNIKINLNPYSNNSDGNVGVNTAIMAGEVDVLASFGLSNSYKRWDNGLFIDITDKCEEEGIDLVEQWGTDVFTHEGKIYSFPCGGLSYYVGINMTAWEEAGLGELPTEWTWDEYLDACKKMTKVAADGTVEVYGGSDYHSTNYFMYAYTQVKGGDVYYDTDGTSTYDNPAVIASLERELQAELVDKIWYPKYSYRADNRQQQMTFCSGEAASGITCNIIRFLHDKETYPDVDWITGFAPYPVEEKGQTNYMSGVTPFSHAGLALNCQDEEASWAFLKWYSTYGVKYLAAAGHQPNWRGTEAGSGIEVIYGSVEEAEKWIDLESFQRVVGRADLPAYCETTLTAYTDVVGALSDPIMQAIAGEMSAADAMAAAAAEADDAIKNG